MILQLDFYGIDHLLSAFEGMGSLNDVVLQRYDGNTAIVPSVETNNFQHCGRKSIRLPAN
ncbi:DUF6966 domain-containing protein [Herbaspirillum robiniae]|uniref:DUF6966 domain-containing protein n=2 Tax=Herbaspirillum robiniae TaxID=2014887 RepID=A0ABX2M010_9BURK|nr:hypothetical protein [Herbaspirillum robiniae]NUU04037.1 hypothetical protein [Herbaspirillum robiniae]